MLDILTKAGSYIAIIILGYVLRKVGFFGEETFSVLSKITLKITLPAAIISGFAGKQGDPALISLSLIALGGGLTYIALGFLLERRGGKERQAFAMLNTAGYNIGNFTLPFVQSFLGPVGVITTSLFDLGNGIICLGGAYSLASMVKDGSRFSLKRVGAALGKSVPFLCHMLMLVMSLARIPIPGPVATLAEIIGNANAFVAMLMIGVGFRLTGDVSQLGRIAKILLVRYGLAAVVALGCWFLLPFEFEVRLALMILAFSPIASAAPAFTAELKGDVGLASALNSVSILCSIAIILAILVIML